MTRVHLVTGAGSGMGACLTRSLVDRGDEVWLVARSAERARELEQVYAGARTLVADLAEPESLAEQLTELPERLDSLLHIAGVVDLDRVEVQSVQQVRHQLDVNLLAPIELTRLCLPALRAGRGTVVVVNSGAGLNANADWTAYAASKFGVRAFADGLRAEESGNGVRVTTVYPSRTATPMQEKVHRQEGRDYDPDRFIQPETVAATILHVLDLPVDATLTEITVRPNS
ncbi:NADP-dependent 3-hydroxy acid dehydrogenase YdfG [Nocardioides daedukensis]|uniref:NADP-dependent 3-hydroxy acid dehydrogenase YdfG n=1 Tax=Nocardioides daedukensis TaxID=634462 RepID=A0A7Y9S1G6_9ACTN|nr:SDR family oxidoreductase [Nocardioides daedukensis]NYG60561.1 NADP-dependent 3-hydroxy acid dehydrogenase YdfG [Nocardioides daedukensis]